MEALLEPKGGADLLPFLADQYQWTPKKFTKVVLALKKARRKYEEVQARASWISEHPDLSCYGPQHRRAERETLCREMEHRLNEEIEGAHQRYMSLVYALGHMFYYHSGIDYHKVRGYTQMLPERLELFVMHVEQLKLGVVLGDVRMATDADVQGQNDGTLADDGYRLMLLHNDQDRLVGGDVETIASGRPVRIIDEATRRRRKSTAQPATAAAQPSTAPEPTAE